jgi:hypothetical protein
MVVVGGTEEKHEDGSYCVRHKNQWIEVGNDPAEAHRRRTKLSEQESPAQQTAPASGAATGTPLSEAAETYFKNLETAVWTLKLSVATEAASIRSSSIARISTLSCGKLQAHGHAVIPNQYSLGHGRS